MRVSFISIAAAAIVASPCDGFLNSIPFVVQVHPELTKYAEAQESAVLKIHLDVGQVEMQNGNPVVTGNRLGIDGLLLELHGKQDATYKQ